ncbi:DUF481 domain-containing protein [bacterium]|nr:DUF481 domain-containing protein [bacterium]
MKHDNSVHNPQLLRTMFLQMVCRTGRRLQLLLFLLPFFIILPAMLHAQVNTEKLRRDGEKTGVFFNTGVALGLVRGNSEFVSVEGDLRFDYVRTDNDNFVVLNYAFKEARQGKIANKGFLHGRSIWDVASALAVEGFAQAEFNEFLSLKNRDLLGAGARWKAIDLRDNDEKSRLEIFLGIGAMFEHEEYDTSPAALRFDRMRSTNYLTLNWTPSDAAAATLIAYAQPLVENPEDVRIITDASVEWKIVAGLHFNVRCSWRYHSRPVTDVKRYDLELTNGLRLSLP